MLFVIVLGGLADFGPNRSPISADSDHLSRSKPITHFGQSDHPSRWKTITSNRMRQ